MTYEEKSAIVIEQLRADRDRLLGVLDKIRAEIAELETYYDNDYFSFNNDPMYKCNEVLQIIDKYTKRE